MHDFRPGKDDKNTILFNSVFVDDDDIEYAINHKFNVLYTETRCTDTFELISKFLKRGYTLEVIEIENNVGMMKLDPKLYAKFIYHDENN